MDRVKEKLRKIIYQIPAIDSHSHAGATPSFISDGILGGGSVYYPDYEPESFSLFDLLLSPYMDIPGDKNALYRESRKDPDRVIKKLMPLLRNIASSGPYQALKMALRDIYGFKDEEITLKNYKDLDLRISGSYKDGYWQQGKKILKKANIEKCIRMVHLPFINNLKRARVKERELFYWTLMIDPLLTGCIDDDMINRKYFRALGFTPSGIDEAIAAVTKTVRSIKKEPNVVGLKDALGYSRSLCWKRTRREDVRGVFPGKRGAVKPSAGDLERYQDFIMRRIFEEIQGGSFATVQMHSGMSYDSNTDPARFMMSYCQGDFPGINFVLLHCYPFTGKMNFIAGGNVYCDNSWLSIKSASVFERAFEEWAGFMPQKNMVTGTDATSFEECYGAQVINREAMVNVLAEKIRKGYLGFKDAVKAANDFLRNNAIDAWRLKADKYYGYE